MPILIEEKTPKKLPGLSSLFVSFDYNSEIVEAMKTIPNRSYDTKTKVWEVPITSLTLLLDRLCLIDDITLHVLKDEVVPEPQEFLLQDYRTKPFDYQYEGIQFGLNHNSWLLLDAPGLGKTLQLIYLAQELKKRDNIEHCLIVCGINTLKHNWKNEIKKHSSLTCRILGERVSKRGNVKIGSVNDRISDLNSKLEEFFIITNIETLRNTDIIKAINKGPNKFDMIVVDEIHTTKNPSSQQGKNLLKLTKAKYKIGATGTLLMNDPLDAYVPLKWIGADKSTYTNFKYFYCEYSGMFNNILVGYKNIDVLKDQLDKFALRRTKDLLNLPPKTIIHEEVDMDSKQAKFYDNIKNGIKDEVDKVDLKTANLLGLIGRLRQATACPDILTTEQIPSAKIDRACDLAEQIVQNGDKVVIFSTFKETLNTLEKKLEKWNPLVCTGEKKDIEISQNIEAFQNNDINKVMLATWQKMGTGITLTRASYAIFIDCAWTSAQNQQAEDRIYRIGSKNPVFIYYLWTNDTVDQRVREIVEDKALISDYIIDDSFDNLPVNLVSKLKDIILDL